MRRPMMHIATTGATLTLALGLAACGNGDDAATDPPPVETPAPTLAPPPETSPSAHGWEGQVQVDFGTGEVIAPDFNALIDAESPAWADSPESTTSVLLRVDELEGEVDIETEADNGNPVVVVTNSELFDDSVAAIRYRITLTEGSDGRYRFDSGEASWRCQPERGQQDFGTDPCS